MWYFLTDYDIRLQRVYSCLSHGSLLHVLMNYSPAEAKLQWISVLVFFSDVLNTVSSTKNNLEAVSSLQQQSTHVDSPLKQEPL